MSDGLAWLKAETERRCLAYEVRQVLLRAAVDHGPESELGPEDMPQAWREPQARHATIATAPETIGEGDEWKAYAIDLEALARDETCDADAIIGCNFYAVHRINTAFSSHFSKAIWYN